MHCDPTTMLVLFSLIVGMAIGAYVYAQVLSRRVATPVLRSKRRPKPQQLRPAFDGGRDVSMYVRQPHLMTSAEVLFLETLRDTVPSTVDIYAQVRLANLLFVNAAFGNDPTPFYRIQGKCVDFVLCDRRTSRILLVVELDDSSHNLPERQARDQFVERALGHAQVPLLRVPCKAQYSAAALKRSIRAALPTTK